MEIGTILLILIIITIAFMCVCSIIGNYMNNKK
jgi:hypothetical protein